MDIYQHFRKEEHPFITRVLSWKEQVERSYQSILTDFLDPREQQIITSLIDTSGDDLTMQLFGGGKYSERKRAIIAPYYQEVRQEDFGVTILQATYHDKFISLSHSDVMGTFLSLGLERRKLGDIVVQDGLIQILLADDIRTYVVMNLTTIKKATVRLETKPLSALVEKELNWILEDKLVSSMRLDTIIKEVYSISRQSAADSIMKKLVKVNYRLVQDRSFSVQADDLISFKGKGRSKIDRINGKTKKEKWKITIAKLK
ncbi:YlmH family RNA-binding protein [Virgibacillus necropolis]|uniref:RNA-binding protein n=1 Tax=Virgibacillus necropolis TaxID=163877 RepID=A0A221ME41_9BACI|nr:YlmH/Sll1252 family protein [Virgibacillus necropolis]ASN05839.1 RNA-binding protein [Virgibacillus necropolis]